MDENRKTRYKRLAIIAAATVGFTTVAYGVWRIAQQDNTKTVEAPRPAPVQMFDAIPAEAPKVENIVGDLIVSPSTLAMGVLACRPKAMASRADCSTLKNAFFRVTAPA